MITASTTRFMKLIDILHAAGSLPQRLDAAGSFVSTYDRVIVANR